MNINKIKMPTAKDDARIQKGIEQDPDAQEISAKDLANMRRASETVPHIVRANRGKQKAPKKESTTVRLAWHVINGFKAPNAVDEKRGWQTRINAVLEHVVEHGSIAKNQMKSIMGGEFVTRNKSGSVHYVKREAASGRFVGVKSHARSSHSSMTTGTSRKSAAKRVRGSSKKRAS